MENEPINGEAPPRRISAELAPKIADWFKTRGGIAIWYSRDINRSGQSWTTPIKGPKGEALETLKPHWSATVPDQIITDPSKVCVDNPVEFKRFHVAVRRGTNGLNYKLTDGASRRLSKFLAQAAEKSDPKCAGSFHVFDYSAQEAVVYYINGSITLSEWIAKQDVKL